MIYFHNDYSEGCHEKVLDRLIKTNMEQTPGYGEDDYSREAARKIRTICGNDNLAVHFLVGGTQTNLTVIAAALRPHQGALGAATAHINVHETGAVEATGHKVLWVPSDDGKVTAAQVADTDTTLYLDNWQQCGTILQIRDNKLYIKDKKCLFVQPLNLCLKSWTIWGLQNLI